MADNEHFELLMRDVDAWNRWRADSPKVKPDLAYAVLRGANLPLANLAGAQLREADLVLANLRGADLRHADLSGANLVGARLMGVDLARQAGLTLIGRAKGRRFVALAGSERIVFDSDPQSVDDEHPRLARKASVEEDAV